MKRSGFLSADRLERRDHLRRIVRREAAERDVDLERLGKRLGYPSPSRWATLMRAGELACVASADDNLLCTALGSFSIIEEKARAAGYRLVREPVTVATPGEVLAGAASTMESVASLVGAVTSALPDGVDPIEARDILGRITEARRALAELEARVESAVVPLRRSSR